MGSAVDFDKFGIEKFTGNNYSTWSTKLEFYLKFKGIHAALGDEKDEKSDQALAAIALSVDNSILPLISSAATAKDAWESLADIYKLQNTASIIRLKTELNSLKKGHNESITSYAGRAFTLKDGLESAGAKVDEMDITLAMLNGLPSTYSTLKSIIENTSPFPGLSPVIAKLMTEEAKHPPGTEKAYFTPKIKSKPVFNRPFIGMRPPLAAAARPYGAARPAGATGGNRPPIDKSKKECYYCHKPGHFIGECRKRLAAEARKGGSSSPDDNVKREVAWMATTSSLNDADYARTWFFDSGAERHITNDAGDLINPVTSSAKVVVGNGEEIAAALEGDVILLESTSKIRRLVLRRVLYIPSFTAKLVSIKMCKLAGASFIMEGNTCAVRMGGETIITATDAPNGIPCIVSNVAGYAPGPALFTKNKETPEVWHTRFGHLGYNGLERLIKHEMVKGMKLKIYDLSSPSAVCEPCVMGKITRLPFKESSTDYTKPLELVSMDVCGPMTVPSFGGSKYAATFIDHATGYSIVRTVKSKADVTPAVKEVLTYMEKQAEASIKAVRTDNGTEYVNSELTTYLKEKGIAHQTSMPYTPEQNGTAERLNRTLINKVLPMLYSADLPPEAWAEAFITANYLRNLAPVSGKTKTPWEMFFGRKPDVSTLRAFGATAYTHVPKEKRSKLDPRAEKGIMIGYPDFGKGYRVLMPDGSIVSSRNVVFDESKVLSKSFINYKPATLVDPTIMCYSADKIGTEVWEPPAELPTSPGASPPGSTPGSSPPGSPLGPLGGPSPAGAPAGAPPAPPSPAAPAGGTDHSGPPPGVTITRYGRASRPPGEWYKANYVGEAPLEPSSYTEAINGPDADLWRTAMDEEIAALAANNTWELDTPPSGVKVIPTKWVFKIKTDADGNIERYKARLVVKGYRQIEGIDYDEVFAPVSKYATLRTVLALASSRDYEIHQVDIKNAFVQGALKEEVWIGQPEGYSAAPGLACRLIKALYGLKQAPRAWHSRLDEELIAMGFTPSDADASLYTHADKEAYILIYVDDILIITAGTALLINIKERLSSVFDARDLGEATYYLGMRITRDRIEKSIKVTHEKMINELASKFDLAECTPRDIPMSPGIKLNKGDGEPLDTSLYPYSSLVGALLYLSVTSRPDISFAVGALSRFMSCPTSVHWGVAKGVLRYLAGKPDFGITFRGSDTTLIGLCDSDYAADPDTRRSTTGYVFTFNGGAITWSSKRQPTIAASTTEAEYMAAAAAVKEALWLRKLMRALKIDTGVINICSDNQGAIKLLRNPISSLRSKHIDVMHHFARERVVRGEVAFSFVPSASNIADALTKPLALSKFEECRAGMGMV